MLNSLEALFDPPPIRPVTLPAYPTQESYGQQMTTWPSDTDLGRAKREGSLFCQIHPYDQVAPNRDFGMQLRLLQRHYTIVESDQLTIELLEEEPTLYPLLIEALIPLQDVFGAGRIIQLRIQVSDDDHFCRVAVQLPPNFSGDPERALRSFDAHWWLDNCFRSDGALVFDYEIQDAV